MPKIIIAVKLVLILLVVFAVYPEKSSAAPAITGITDNRAIFPNSGVPKYEKFEITFSVGGSTATNTFYPYEASTPQGIPAGIGISVNAIFTDPQGAAHAQPGFYFQEFQDLVKSNKDWLYPTGNYSWKVRFAPNKTGTWKYKLTVTDSGGTSQSTETTFNVVESTNKGFIKVSPTDSRYFEYDNGTFFPALGYNSNGGDLDNLSPGLGNESKFRTMQENGIEITRVWISQFSIFGESYGKWGSPNRVHATQEPRYGIVNPINSQFAVNYPSLVPPNLPSGSEYYMWLEYNATVSPDGTQQRLTPCRTISQIAVKQNTGYRIKVRYKAMNMEGPMVAGLPFGFTIKTSTPSLSNATTTCNEPAQGNVVAASYNAGQVTEDPANPGWSFLEGAYNNGTSDFLPFLYIGFNNVKSTDGDNAAGHVFVDRVWVEEANCTGNCPNLLSKPWMSMHQYINQRDAFAFDKLLKLSNQYGIYLKAVMNEKNDRIFQTIDFNGQPVANQSTINFYGNGTAVNKVRWLQQAWWRYMQARWGYSANIHSWELLNEGDASVNHLTQADEFGKYMHCRVFGVQPLLDPTLGNICKLTHPNSHMVTTSFSGSMYPWQFWNNGGSAAGYKLYRDIDYADQHYYSEVDDTGPLASYYDSALFSYKLSTAASFAANTRKPLMRGETAWGPPADILLETNADGGEWLHDFIWAGINHGGLMEHFFGGGHYTRQIYNLSANPPYDHRPMFKTFHNFIKNIPLNNGNYADAGTIGSHADLRAWGQKDTINKRAHIWIANKNHTWKSVVDGATISPISGTVTLSGFTPNTSYPTEWWNTYTGTVSNTGTQNANANGDLVISVNNLTTDTAVRIGNYTAPPASSTSNQTSLSGDINSDNTVNLLDYILLSNKFGTNDPAADLNRDSNVNILDFTVLNNNFGRTN